MKKTTKWIMAEYIRQSDCLSCDVCVNEQKCNEKYALAEEKGKTYEPRENYCIKGIIKYFEQKRTEEQEE